MSPDEKSAFDKVEFQAHNYFDPHPRKDTDAFMLRRCLQQQRSRVYQDLESFRAGCCQWWSCGKTTDQLEVDAGLDSHLYTTKAKMLRREDIAMTISVGGKER